MHYLSLNATEKEIPESFKEIFFFQDNYSKASIKPLCVYLIFTLIEIYIIYIYIYIYIHIHIGSAWVCTYSKCEEHLARQMQRCQAFLLSLREIFVRTEVQCSFVPFSRVKFLNFLSFSQFLTHKMPHFCIFCARRDESRAQCMKTSQVWVKTFKNGPSKICGRQLLKNLKWYGLKV